MHACQVSMVVAVPTGNLSAVGGMGSVKTSPVAGS
jgi:hypothetical protein